LKIFLVDLESVASRYTSEWKTHVPKILKDRGYDVQTISGPDDIPAATTPGAFLNFGGTNIYKSSQIEQISRLFCSGDIKPGDHFVFTDAWHPGIINVKYMSELLGIPIVTHGLWHAGNYDPQDFLGRIVGNKPWVSYAEKSFFHAFDHNYFATNFHINLFCENLLDMPWEKAHLLYGNKIIHSGWPMEYLKTTFDEYDKTNKRDLILFPHRIAPEKQVDIFKDLAKQLPEYEFVVCQDLDLTKEEYHKLLCESKLVFSANLQETLGISCYEALLANSIPLVPDRLSYTEMYDDDFKYPSLWTQNFDSYLIHREKLCELIKDKMTNYSNYVWPTMLRRKKVLYYPDTTKESVEKNLLIQQINKLTGTYFTAANLLPT